MKHYTFQDNTKHPLDLSRDVSFSLFLSEKSGGGSRLASDLQNLTNALDYPNFRRVYATNEEAFDARYFPSLKEGINFSLLYDHQVPPLNYTGMGLPHFRAVFNPSGEQLTDECGGNIFFISVTKGLVVSKRPLQPESSSYSNFGEIGNCQTDMKLRQLKKFDTLEFYEMNLEGVQKLNIKDGYIEAEDLFFAQFLEALTMVMVRLVDSLSELEVWPQGFRFEIPIFACIEAGISASLKWVMVALELLQILLCSIYHGTEINGHGGESPLMPILVRIVSSLRFFNNFPFLLAKDNLKSASRILVEILDKYQVEIAFLALGKPSDFKLVLQKKESSCTFLLHKEVIQHSPFFLGVSSIKYGWGGSSLSLDGSNLSYFPFTIALNYMYFNALPELSMVETIATYTTANFLSVKELEAACIKRLYALMHNLTCGKSCCKANFHVVFGHALEFNIQELTVACCNLLYKQTGFWTEVDFDKLPESVLRMLSDMATSSLIPQSAVRGLVLYHLLNQKLKRRVSATIKKPEKLSQSIFKTYLSVVISNFSWYLKDTNKDLMELLSGSNWSSDLIELIFDSLIASLTHSNALELWVQIYRLLKTQTRLGPKGLPLNIYDITPSKDIVTKSFKKIGLFIRRNQLRIAIEGGFSNLPPGELNLIKQELELNPDFLEAKLGSKEYNSPMNKTTPFHHMGKSRDQPNKPIPSRIAGNLRRREPDFEVGSRVKLLSPLRYGTLRYVGPLGFVSGVWYGIELDTPVGKSDGLVQGTRYFQTQTNRALFVKREKLSLA